jgi:hypothetical protein
MLFVYTEYPTTKANYHFGSTYDSFNIYMRELGNAIRSNGPLAQVGGSGSGGVAMAVEGQ